MSGRLIEFVILFPAVLALSWIMLSLAYVVRREWRLPLDPGFLPTVAVVVPAHNEELVLAAALEALLEQDYPAVQIHVVSDGSTDATVAIARSFAPRGVVLHELTANGGKSAALQHVLDRVSADLFLVVDADTRTRPGAIGLIVQQFADPRVGAVTGHARVGNVTGVLTAVQAMEYSVIVGLAKRAEQFWGGLYTVSGAAACFRAAALREVGGWTVDTVTEDIEMSWRLQRAGWLLAYDPRAVFLIQAPASLRALHRQRRRWARGMIEVLRLHWNVSSSRNRALIPITAQVLGAACWMLLATFFLVGTLARTLAGAVFSGLPGGLDGLAGIGELAGPSELAGAEWLVLLLWTMGLFGVQTGVAGLFDGAYVAGGWRVVPLFLVFPFYFWLVVYPSFILGAAQGLFSRRSGSARWSRTERTPMVRDLAGPDSPLPGAARSRVTS